MSNLIRVVALTICILFISACTHAEEVDKYEVDKYETCQLTSDIGGIVMVGRQNGISMSKMVDTVRNFPVTDKATSELCVHMIAKAYDSPRYYSENLQQRAVEDFKNDVYLLCLKALKNR